MRSPVQATLRKVPAGTHLTNASVELTAADNIGGVYGCSLVSTQPGGTPGGVAGEGAATSPRTTPPR